MSIQSFRHSDAERVYSSGVLLLSSPSEAVIQFASHGGVCACVFVYLIFVFVVRVMFFFLAHPKCIFFTGVRVFAGSRVVLLEEKKTPKSSRGHFDFGVGRHPEPEMT